ncbi:hypothetical protein LY76DRAFT_396415 [Colletotrichum caudatum]|nr:hypothetical protein LY76DRAFT_396415 [Colletotrichum caudatum]
MLYWHLNSISFIHSTYEGCSSRRPIKMRSLGWMLLWVMASAIPRRVCRSKRPKRHPSKPIHHHTGPESCARAERNIHRFVPIGQGEKSKFNKQERDRQTRK